MDQAMTARPTYDRAKEDLGNIVEFGHVNVRIPDQRLATLFYVSGLGLTRDPFLVTGVENMWINVGTSQFHLPGGPAQVLRGRVGLVVPDLDALEGRLKRVRSPLAGTKFAFSTGDAWVDATCPWGNRIRCHAPDARWGSMALGMAYVELLAPPGTAAGIARFYREALGASGATADGGTASVPVGADLTLIFQETNEPQPDFDGNHIQISLANFSGPHAWLLARGLVTEESDQHQYRFQDVVDVDSGRVLVTAEHEVRSMRHPLYARPLVNRNPAQTNQRYTPGHELLAWTSAPA
jgi:catechol 2,3-dioxygenase-like lactoylglutathione lyase family enzyme